MRILEFSNNGSQSDNQESNSKSPIDIINQQRFELSDESDENQGLAIAPNGMAAVDYNISENSFAVRPDNDLALDSQTLAKFKQDIMACEKLATQLSRIGSQV